MGREGVFLFSFSIPKQDMARNERPSTGTRQSVIRLSPKIQGLSTQISNHLFPLSSQIVMENEIVVNSFRNIPGHTSLMSLL